MVTVLAHDKKKAIVMPGHKTNKATSWLWNYFYPNPGNILKASAPFVGPKLVEGTTVFPLLTSVLKDSKHSRNPANFDPGHCLDKNGKFQKNEAFMQFSTGRRILENLGEDLGEGMAKMEIFIFLTFILQNFNLKSDEDPSHIDVSPLPNTNGTTPHPYEIRFVPR
ncbi:putative inactive cytochrome P450 2G1 [Pseudophryne corroboree]|uniref:putative inactive cytochrome P450 2G1 n=1 Tax=Pseudophryne corroboree TaxID=495146 RepID=UPI0030817086